MDEVPIAGEGFRLTLRVGDYEERVATGDVWEDNWLGGSAETNIAQPPTATFRAKCDVAWQTTELHAFYESLRTVLEDLTGTAKLMTIEDQVEHASTPASAAMASSGSNSTSTCSGLTASCQTAD